MGSGGSGTGSGGLPLTGTGIRMQILPTIVGHFHKVCCNTGKCFVSTLASVCFGFCSALIACKDARNWGKVSYSVWPINKTDLAWVFQPQKALKTESRSARWKPAPQCDHRGGSDTGIRGGSGVRSGGYAAMTNIRRQRHRHDISLAFWGHSRTRATRVSGILVLAFLPARRLTHFWLWLCPGPAIAQFEFGDLWPKSISANRVSFGAALESH